MVAWNQTSVSAMLAPFVAFLFLGDLSIAVRADDASQNSAVSELDALEDKLESTCGDEDNSVAVANYSPSPNRDWRPDTSLVQRVAPSTGILWWRDFEAEASREGVSTGTVNKKAWCSGTLIGLDTFLTAAHCLRISTGKNKTHRTPYKTISGANIDHDAFIKYLSVFFNYQAQRLSETVGPVSEYPVINVVEHGDKVGKFKDNSLDYAIVRLGRGLDGRLPGERFRIADLDTRKSSLDAAKMLTIVQHPAGKPKRVDGGERCFWSGVVGTGCADEKGTDAEVRIFYDDLDTLGGTSGAGILNESGAVIGVHTLGGCEKFTGGANSGYSLYSISQVSKIIPKQK